MRNSLTFAKPASVKSLIDSLSEVRDVPRARQQLETPRTCKRPFDNRDRNRDIHQTIHIK